MRVRVFHSVLATIGLLSLSGAASAHFDLKAPMPSSTSTNGGKGGPPCGPDAPSAVVTPVTGGTMLPIRIAETVPHPGHYRIALALNSRDEIDTSKPNGLKEPVVKDAEGMVLMNENGSGDSETAEIQNPPVFPVLADGPFPHTEVDGEFMGSVMLPNVNCDKCTLQVIQFMSKHGPDYFYRHCADLKITADPNKPLFDPKGMGGGGSGGMGGTGGAGGSAAGGTGGAAGSLSGGAPSAGSTAMGGMPSSTGGGGASAAGTSAGGSSPAAAPPADDGGCSVAGASGSGKLALLGAGMLLGLGWLGRRRNRTR